MESLEKMAQKLAQEAYKATAPQEKEAPESDPNDQDRSANQGKKPGNKDDIIDADFTAVNSGFPNDIPKV
jgi:hypothetical protein